MNALPGIRYGSVIAAAASRHGLDPRLLAAVAAQETGGPDADSGRNIVGDAGHGHGLFQIDDRWHAFATTAAAMDPAANAEYAAGMLQGLLRRFGGDLRSTLSAYNSGSPTGRGATTLWKDGTTLGYADSVLRHLGRITDELRGERPGDAQAAGGLADAARRFGTHHPHHHPHASAVSPVTTSSATSSAPSSALTTSGSAVGQGASAPSWQFHTFTSEMQSANGVATDADTRLAALVAGDRDLFEAPDDAHP